MVSAGIWTKRKQAMDQFTVENIEIGKEKKFQMLRNVNQKLIKNINTIWWKELCEKYLCNEFALLLVAVRQLGVYFYLFINAV